MPLQIPLKGSGNFIPAIGTIVASLFLLTDDWLSAISYLQQDYIFLS
jgi:uncharacterized protein involved in cysteine biosynthesis